jgi:hypothetical protein
MYVLKGSFGILSNETQGASNPQRKVLFMLDRDSTNKADTMASVERLDSKKSSRRRRLPDLQGKLVRSLQKTSRMILCIWQKSRLELLHRPSS